MRGVWGQAVSSNDNSNPCVLGLSRVTPDNPGGDMAFQKHTLLLFLQFTWGYFGNKVLLWNMMTSIDVRGADVQTNNPTNICWSDV